VVDAATYGYSEDPKRRCQRLRGEDCVKVVYPDGGKFFCFFFFFFFSFFFSSFVLNFSIGTEMDEIVERLKPFGIGRLQGVYRQAERLCGWQCQMPKRHPMCRFEKAIIPTAPQIFYPAGWSSEDHPLWAPSDWVSRLLRCHRLQQHHFQPGGLMTGDILTKDGGRRSWNSSASTYFLTPTIG